MTRTTTEERAGFPGPDAVPAEAVRLAASLKRRYLSEHPQPHPAWDEFQMTYARLFSKEGLPGTTPAELKHFANERALYSGNMSMFNRYWNRVGDEEAAAQVRGLVEYLRDASTDALEGRLTELITSEGAPAIPGFREGFLWWAKDQVHGPEPRDTIERMR